MSKKLKEHGQNTRLDLDRFKADKFIHRPPHILSLFLLQWGLVARTETEYKTRLGEDEDR